MSQILLNSSVKRVVGALRNLGIESEITILSESARSAKEAADSLGIEVGQVASSIVFKLPDGSPLLVITSGRHKVDIALLAEKLSVEKLHRCDADYVKSVSGFSIGGVAPIGWISPATIVIDQALNDYDIVWAAAGHPHSVFPTTFEQLQNATGATPMIVAED
ncbi:MAG: YbaK/EbsC family protein [Actinobacteria bacterium]|nr:YbaK/EbsC family protein [Actinomycetota bacterium]